ncbi:MAG: Arm DNA-binding domain-containing protein [Trichlorobacter sp.]|uniref:Arm DNA-binding domain-containing protein n=1 Tax=Trichlorobacter sp. TaxID=2911007 RepID=UPI00255D577F|nr:Arm DNA-binding domain-containing protein [Trichlorobacter sp.]MDK9719234.1 Arm DNA-binding domain-containing protein [Trichlorobacter sp.]
MPPKKGKITFTVKWLNALKPAEKELTWTESHGFTIRVLPSGVKTWWYYYILNGKRRKMNLGIYPYVSLEEARKLHREALGQVERGMDPMAPPPEPTPEPEVLTVNALAEKWIEHSQRIHTKKWSNTLILALKKDFLPSHGHRLVTELKRRDAIEILRIKSLTAPGQAVNLHKSLRGMWELGVNPTFVQPSAK